MKLGVSNFFQDVSNFLRSGSVLGIDLGTVSVKMAEISEKKGKFKLENYGILETKNYLSQPNRVIQTSALKLVEKDIYEYLRILLSAIKPKTKNVLVSVPSFAVFITTIDMPLLSREETGKAIMFQARQYIPLPVSLVSIDWFKIEEFVNVQGERSQRILLIGVPNEIIRKYRNIFDELGLKLIALEVESLALTRALSKKDDGVTMMIDLGAESTNIIITENGVLKYNGQTDYGGIYLTQALSRGLGVSVSRAEELKRRRGLTGEGGEMELSTLILPFLDVILQEIRHTKDVYERRFLKKVEKVIVCGGGAKLLGIQEYFSGQLNLPFAAPETLKEILHPIWLESAMNGLNADLAIAVGLTKRYFV